MNYEVKEKAAATYGIWNKDMCAFQFIPEWDSVETTDIDAAHKVCSDRNNGIFPKQAGTFGGLGMGTF